MWCIFWCTKKHQLNYTGCMQISQIVVFFLTEQQGTARNASLVKERVKIVPMKKGNLLLFYVTLISDFCIPLFLMIFSVTWCLFFVHQWSRCQKRKSELSLQRQVRTVYHVNVKDQNFNNMKEVWMSYWASRSVFLTSAEVSKQKLKPVPIKKGKK